MDQPDPVKDFYDSDVPYYQAVQEYTGPFNSAYYMGSGFDRTPAETIGAEILHADHDPEAVKFLERNGYQAVEQDVTDYNPDEVFDLIILSHLPTQSPPRIEENLKADGTVICRTDGKAREINEITSLNLQAVYDEAEEMIVTEEPEIQEAEMYIFQF